MKLTHLSPVSNDLFRVTNGFIYTIHLAGKPPKLNSNLKGWINEGGLTVSAAVEIAAWRELITKFYADTKKY
jgi:hypothetical protein